MIDLEGLAAARAQALAQDSAAWVSPIQEDFFQIACSHLSDGEIQLIFSLACSSQQMCAVFEGLADAFRNGISSAFDVWKKHFDDRGVSTEDAIKEWQKVWEEKRNFSHALNALSIPAPKRTPPKLRLVGSQEKKKV